MAKRGPKRKEGLPREPNGRQVRNQEHISGVELRIRVFGLSPSDAMDQKAGSFVGRLRIAGQNKRPEGIDEREYNAALRYFELYNMNLRAIGAEGAIHERGEGPSIAADEDEQAKAVANIKARWKAAQAAVQAKQNECRENLFAALEYCVIRDCSFVNMVGTLRLALNALATHFEGNRKAQQRAA
jgi:hypothetical protein